MLNGTLMFTSDTAYPVLGPGGVNHADILLRRAGDTAAASLESTNWKPTMLRGAPVPPVDRQREAHLLLDPKDKRVGYSGECNQLIGAYSRRDAVDRAGCQACICHAVRIGEGPVRQSLYVFVSLANLTMTAPFAAAGVVSGEWRELPMTSLSGWVDPSPPQRDPQAMFSWLAIRNAASSDDTPNITEVQFTWSTGDDPRPTGDPQ